MSHDRRTMPLSSPNKGVPKTQNGGFSCKIELRLKKVLQSFLKTVSGKVLGHLLA